MGIYKGLETQILFSFYKNMSSCFSNNDMGETKGIQLRFIIFIMISYQMFLISSKVAFLKLKVAIHPNFYKQI